MTAEELRTYDVDQMGDSCCDHAWELLREVRCLRDEAESWAETVEEWKDLYKLSKDRNHRLREALGWYAKSSVAQENQVARRALKAQP